LLVRVLLDENLPLEFAAEFQGHVVSTVRGIGWAGVQNGELMRRAVTACDVFITMDKNLPHQQNIPALPFSVVLVRARTNRLIDLRPLVAEILVAIEEAQPGVLRRVGA
jgi:predicted nuclease of predicted toxin-antitoxin system